MFKWNLNNFITFCQILLRENPLQKTVSLKLISDITDEQMEKGCPYLSHASAFPPANAHVQWKHWWSVLDIHLPLSLMHGKADLQWDEPQSKEQEENYIYIKEKSFHRK